jgi:hypothetical protein
MRGRNRPKGPNPLTRSYESNGPDVKIRGTAQHIADKYAQLARDALAAGDPVAAENYFQHGEHYFRIISGAQEQNRPAAGLGYARQPYDDEIEDGDDDGMQQGHGGQGQNGQGYAQYGDDYGDPGQQPQPYEMRQENGQDLRQQDNRQNRNDRRERFQNRGDRQRFDNPRFDNQRQDNRQEGRQDNRQEHRQDYSRSEQPRQDYGRQEQPRENRFENGRGEYQRPEPVRPDSPRQDFQRPSEGPSRRERRRDESARSAPEEQSALPAFLVNPTRAPAPAEPTPEAPANGGLPHAAESVPEAAEEAPRAAAKPRRRRRTRFEGAEGAEGGAETAAPAESSAE